jgi:hypothetical protein
MPALLDTTVRSFTPLSRTASISTAGMPHRPKPPDMMVMPSRSRPGEGLARVGNTFRMGSGLLRPGGRRVAVRAGR